MSHDKRQRGGWRGSAMATPKRSIARLSLGAALIGSPWTDEAIKRLETLYRDAKDEDGLAEMLFHRAERTKDPEEARALALGAAELATEKGRNPEGAIELWEKLIERYGASPDVHRRLMPLLIAAKRFFEVCDLVEQEIAWAEPAERPQLWMDLADLRMTRLGDPDGALRAYQQALALEPGHKGARSAAEKLLNLPDTRELAAEIWSRCCGWSRRRWRCCGCWRCGPSSRRTPS